MAIFITGLFDNSDHAGKAVAELKNKELDNNLSILTKDEFGNKTDVHEVSKDPMHGVKGGAVSGAAVGGLGALALGATAVTIPGLGLVVAGPLATFLTALGGGAVTGGVVGALVDQGMSRDLAEEFDQHIKQGDVMTAVSTDDTDDAASISKVLKAHGAKKVEIFQS